ncbi:MAG: bifunctional folylpolyglutamate synthase/dihydrofolate synthase [Candidatus Marsarchaeota archaeon]|nr:bifunctional folylpolyglutamate synthase/dihydrofolate synthase [Candidatus Marsarchaeota archaeon]
MANSSSTYHSALSRFASFSRFGSKPGLQRIEKILSLLGDPQKDFKCILVAGTNGKGSTTAMLAKILAQSGRRTGSYFSPSVFSFRERIQMNGKWISKKDFAACADEVFALLPPMRSDPPTFFEVMTAMAVLYFAREKADYAVLEVGLGGRFDATNAVEPELSIITSIGLEHTDVLGGTTSKIAREKAGILRSGAPVVCAVKDRPALGEIKKISKRLRSPFYFVEGKSAATFARRAGLPSFQSSNLACALKAAELTGVKPPVARAALSSFSMPARWQKINSHPSVIIDCCHNPPAAKMIGADLRQDFSFRPSSPRVLLFSAMADKEYSAVLRLLLPHFDSVVLCRPPYARAAKIKDLEKAVKLAKPAFLSISDPDSALSRAKSLAGKNGRVLVCGSIYLLQWLFGEREFRITG